MLIFRKLLRLVNDWRDSLFVAAVVAASGVRWYYGYRYGQSLLGLLDEAIFALLIRENARLFTWWATHSLVPTFVAYIGMGAVYECWTTMLVIENSLDGYWLLACINLLMVAGTLSAVASISIVRHFGFKSTALMCYATYRSRLWDYPRKQKPPRRRRKLRQVLHDWLSKLGDVFGPAPEPARGYIPIPVHRLEEPL